MGCRRGKGGVHFGGDCGGSMIAGLGDGGGGGCISFGAGVQGVRAADEPGAVSASVIPAASGILNARACSAAALVGGRARATGFSASKNSWCFVD